MVSSSHGQEAQEAVQPPLPNLWMHCTYRASYPTFACPRLMKKSPTHGQLRASGVPKPTLLETRDHSAAMTEQRQQTVACNSACKCFPHLGLGSQSSKYNCKRSSAWLHGPQRIVWARLSTQVLAPAPRKVLGTLSGVHCSCPSLMILSGRHTSR